MRKTACALIALFLAGFQLPAQTAAFGEIATATMNPAGGAQGSFIFNCQGLFTNSQSLALDPRVQQQVGIQVQPPGRTGGVGVGLARGVLGRSGGGEITATVSQEIVGPTSCTESLLADYLVNFQVPNLAPGQTQAGFLELDYGFVDDRGLAAPPPAPILVLGLDLGDDGLVELVFDKQVTPQGAQRSRTIPVQIGAAGLSVRIRSASTFANGVSAGRSYRITSRASFTRISSRQLSFSCLSGIRVNPTLGPQGLWQLQVQSIGGSFQSPNPVRVLYYDVNPPLLAPFQIPIAPFCRAQINPLAPFVFMDSTGAVSLTVPAALMPFDGSATVVAVDGARVLSSPAYSVQMVF